MDYMYVMDYMHIMELVYWVITVYLYLKCMDQREISKKWKKRWAFAVRTGTAKMQNGLCCVPTHGKVDMWQVSVQPRRLGQELCHAHGQQYTAKYSSFAVYEIVEDARQTIGDLPCSKLQNTRQTLSALPCSKLKNTRQTISALPCSNLEDAR
jgi:hypothetical protein